VFLLLIFTALQPVWGDLPLEIITLKSRPVDEVIPLIEPFVGPDGALSGMNNKLIVRTSPERLREIRKILEQIDKPPRRLRIYVTQDRFRHQERDRVSAGASVNIGESGKIDVGRPVSGEDRLEASIRSTRSRGDLASTQSVQTLEGSAAFIATGTAFPVPIRQPVIVGGVVRYGRGVEYRNAATGFYVLPRVTGDLVTLEISTQMDEPDSGSRSFVIQRAHSTVSGRMGKWIDIGRIDTQEQVSRSGILQRAKTTDREGRRILLLVEEIP
jgi:type II secretory pathway component GspD/PulD (secretin)